MSLSVNIQTIYSTGIIDQSGNLMEIVLVMSIIISFMLIDTKYHNLYTYNLIEMFYKPLLLVFIAMLIFKIRLSMLG